MLTRRPAPRPWDVIALELLLTLACAIQVGLLLWLAVATWDDRGASGVTIGVLVVVALGVGAGWFLWLTGLTGWVLAATSGIAALQVALLLVLTLAGQLHGLSTTVLGISLAAALLGAACGVFLPAPSSRRYRSAPRARSDAGGPPSAPRVSPGVAAAADRYAKPVVAGAAAVTAAGAKKLSRSPAPAAQPADGEVAPDAEPDPVLQPRSGTPIRTSGPVDPDAAVTASAGRSATPARGTPAAGTPSVTSTTPPTGTPARGTATATPSPATASGATTRPAPRPTPKPGAPRPDPGAIARQARADIDAELAKPRGTAKAPGGTSAGTPGFRSVAPPPPTTKVPSSRSDIRFTPSGRTAPPPPPRGQPVGRAGDVQQPGDPGAISPTIRAVSPPPPMPDPGYDADDPGPATGDLR